MTHEDHHRVSSLVTDLVEMAQASKRLPELERELSDARATIARDGATISRLELKLMDRASEIDDLRAKLRSVEVERDDAGFRQLEAEDRANALRDTIQSVVSTLGTTLGVVNGDGRTEVIHATSMEVAEFKAWKVELEMRREEAERTQIAAVPTIPTASSVPSEAEAASTGWTSYEGGSGSPIPGNGNGDPAYPAPQGERAADPIASTQDGSLSQNACSETAVSQANVSGIASEGQSDPFPTQAPGTASSPDGNASSSVNTGDAVRPESAQPTPTERHAETKYRGLRYKDVPYVISERSWIEGGGTSESYWDGREHLRSA